MIDKSRNTHKNFDLQTGIYNSVMSKSQAGQRLGESCVEYFAGFLDPFFHLCIIPYQIKTPSFNQVTLETTPMKKIIAGVFHILFLLFILLKFIGVFFINESGLRMSPLVIIFAKLLFYIQYFTTIYFMWMKQEDFLRFLHLINKYPYSKAQKKGLLTFIVYIGSQVIMEFLILYEKVSTTEAEETGIFLEIPFIRVTESNNRNLFIMGYCFMEFSIFVISAITDGFILLLTVVFRNLNVHLIDTVKCSKSFSTVLSEFEHLKLISSAGKYAFGYQVISNCICTAYYYATGLRGLLSPGNVVQKMYILPWMLATAVFWGFAADAHHKISSVFKEWIFRTGKTENISTNLLVTTISDVNECQVGVGCPVFTINYSIINSLVGIILTYGIIMYQMGGQLPGLQE